MVDQIKTIEEEDALEQPVDTADPQEVNKSRKKEARKRSDRLEFVRAAMGLQQGRAWFYDLLNYSRVFRVPFNDDPYKTAFLCGEQNIGLQILADIQDAAPDEYLTMIKENKNFK